MPNLTTALPRRTGNLEDDYNRLYNWAVSLTDELKSLLCNLDAGNVTEAASIKAQNIDASQAKIKDAQITSLTADKLTAGTIDAQGITSEKINVINLIADNITAGTLNSDLVSVGAEDENGSAYISGQQYMLVSKTPQGVEVIRYYVGRNEEGKYIFRLQNQDASQGVYMDDDGVIEIIEAVIGRKITITAGRRGEEGAVISVSPDGSNLTILAKQSRSIYIGTEGNVDISCNTGRLNGKRILTTDDLE